MLLHSAARTLCLIALTASTAQGADWKQFRGPDGSGKSDQIGVPLRWSSDENIVWKADLPGPGTSSPIAVGDSVYLTCYSGYGLEPSQGDMQALMRYVVCVDRTNGEIAWTKALKPDLPVHVYQGNGAHHGYSSSTPTSDGERLFVFFGKSGVYCFDLAGNELWHQSVGTNVHHWGSATSPVLYGDLLIVNASVESDSLVALDKATGDEVWRTDGIKSSWNTPVFVPLADNRTELVVSIRDHLLGIDPANGEELWRATGIHRYVCPSVVSHENQVFAIGGGHTSLSVRAGGRGDVTETHALWRKNKGSNVSSPIYHDGHLYWASDSRGIVYCQDAASGEFVYEERLSPSPGIIYASPLLAGGKLYYVSQHQGTYVLPARPEFQLLARNVFADDDSRTNASLVVDAVQPPENSSDQRPICRLLLRSDRYLYCIGRN